MNIIQPQPPSNADLDNIHRITGRENILENYSDFLVDESKSAGEPVECIYLPESTDEVSGILRFINTQKRKVTVSGSRTGIVAGAVTRNVNCLISLSRMNRVIAFTPDSITVESGMTLDELNDFVSSNIPDRFYPVDPTETTASIGGMVACNASGARTFHYGPTRYWVNAVTVVLADGSILKLRRLDVKANHRSFIFRLENQPETIFEFPFFKYPESKNTAGILLDSDMDAVDLFVGSEGILGVITEIELQLIPKPKNRLYTIIWTESELQSIKVVRKLCESETLDLLAIEYFDPNSIDILKNRRTEDGESSIAGRIR